MQMLFKAQIVHWKFKYRANFEPARASCTVHTQYKEKRDSKPNKQSSEIYVSWILVVCGEPFL